MLDTLQRYIPVVKYIRQVPCCRNSEILEVGGGMGGIGELLPECRIVNYDKADLPSGPPNVKNVKSTGTNIAFPDNSFDISICIDTIEHLPQAEEKSQMIKELNRVTRKRIILSIPCGQRSWDMVKKFANHYYGKTSDRFVSLDEHLTFGHPEKDDILKYIREVNSHAAVCFKKNANIHLWFYLMSWQFKYPKIFLNRSMRKFLWLKPLLSLMNFGVPLRYIFVIDKK